MCCVGNCTASEHSVCDMEQWKNALRKNHAIDRTYTRYTYEEKIEEFFISETEKKLH